MNIETMRAFVELRRVASSYAAIEKRLEQIEEEPGARRATESNLQGAEAVDLSAASKAEAAGRLQVARGP